MKNLLLSGIFLFAVHSSWALPEGFVVTKISEDVINLGVSLAPVNDGRIFIAERGGALKVLKDGEVSTVITIETELHVNRGDENGLTKVIPHPDFDNNGRLYLFYQDPVEEWHNIDIVTLNSQNEVTDRSKIIQMDPTSPGNYQYHNGSGMAFGHDGFLYVGRGDNFDEQAKASDPSNQIGKILRYTEDGDPAPGNPFATAGDPAVWATGVSAPWVLATDPLSGRIYVSDVGETWEEVNEVSSPDPDKDYWYGWGEEQFNGITNDPGMIDPVVAYANTGGAAILSAAPYNPPVNNFGEEYLNKLFYNDYAQSWIKYIDMDDPAQEPETFTDTALTGQVDISMVIGPNGHMYFMTYRQSGGYVYTIHNSLAVSANPGLNQSTDIRLIKNIISSKDFRMEFKTANGNPLQDPVILKLFNLEGQVIYTSQNSTGSFLINAPNPASTRGVLTYSLESAGYQRVTSGVIRVSE